MRRGIPADVLAARLGFLLRLAHDHSNQGDAERVRTLLTEAQDVLNQLRQAL